MSGITWAHPDTVGEALHTLAANPTARLHGGGTGLLRSDPREGLLVDLSRAGLGAITKEGGHLLVGATATLAELLERAAAVGGETHLLVQALRETATPALRNRITVGGSVAMFPPWSGLIGPLVALDAEVELAGGVGGTGDGAARAESRRSVPIVEYLTENSSRRGTIVTAVRFALYDDARYGWYRFVRLHFDYASFSLAVVLRGGDTGSDGAATIHDARIVLVGTQNRFDRLNGVEERLSAGAPAAVSIADLPSAIPARNGFSSEYLTEVAIVQLQRILNEMTHDRTGGLR